MGGGDFFLGSLKISLFLTVFFKIYIKIIAAAKPNRGDKSRACPISIALSQLIEEIPLFEASGNKACPTPIPIMEPISVCELDAGIPKYHVPTFQRIAESNNANAMAMEWYTSASMRSSVGNSPIILIVTPTPPVRRPRKFMKPDQTTA